MPFSSTGKNTALDALGVTAMSLHTANPTDTGLVGELAGGSYARKAVTFNAASGGSTSMSQSQVDFDVPGGNTVSHFALWNGSNACIAYGTLSSSEAYGADGIYRLTSLTMDLNG
ncbi:phage tail fiber protein [Ferrimonas balearica]|uniref:phage tail fiber protein n=1 Tax=Ferrimonas balearica TaxID=44012 RepID=UPI001F1DCB2A|nr:hypothetical protein [Ferrimonas balearica]MBY6093848.1 hypothetical protein [Ferrimonas balearica]